MTILIVRLLYLITIIVVVTALYTLYKTKTYYEKGKPLPKTISMCWIIVDSLDIILIIVASIYGVWHIPFNWIVIRLLGIILAFAGFAIMLIGMIEFRSARKVLGMEVSKLITTGIYRWSRNPQFLGWYFLDIGIALAGLSGYALIVGIITVIFCHYYIVKLEEPFLERIFGKEYIRYKQKTPRYIGIPRQY